MKKFVVAYIELEWYSIDIENYIDFKDKIDYKRGDTVISFQISDLIRELNSKGKNLPTIIDLESLDKQMSQEGSDLREYRQWKVLSRLKHYKILEPDFRLTKANIQLFLEYIATLYKQLIDKDSVESKRFFDVELAVNAVIYKAQKLGIGINLEIANNRCKELDLRIYEIKNILQLEHNIFTPDDIETQINYLDKKKYTIIRSLEYSFRIRNKSDIVCNLFYELSRNQKDLDSLLFILSHWGGAGRTYPYYIGFGTITSRIILRQPSLQNLRRSNRDIIVPDPGTSLLYIDYGQFEAGILASLSDDKSLIKLYDSDIYFDLALQVIGNKEERGEAKIIFYRYMYGDTSLPKEALNYFQKFKELQIFKKQIDKEISVYKKIGTEHGNYRRSFEEETSWALSHRVQSTASYIYKMALIRVSREVRLAQFLIPMHDGTVYQINKYAYEESKEKIENIYKEEFKKVCPQITPIVNIKEEFR